MASPGPTSSNAGASEPAGIAHDGLGRRADLYLLCGDDSLLLELGPLLGDRYRTRPIDSAEELNPAGTAPWMLVIDATARTDARAQAARIEARYPRAPLIVICADGRSADWTSAISRGMVRAVIDRGTLQSGALNDALREAELRLDAAAGASANRTAALQEATGSPPPRRVLWLWLTPLLVLGATAAWFSLSRHKAVPAAAPQAATALPAAGVVSGTVAPSRPTSPAPTRSVLELLSAARIAFRGAKDLLPRAEGSGHGDSALELYAAVLAQEPQNDEARDGVRRLFSVARARIQSDLAAGRLDEATRLLTAFRAAGYGSEATARLEADIAAARPRWLIAQARSALAGGDTETARQLITQIAAVDSDPAVLRELRRALESRSADARAAELADRTRAAISAGALLEPAADNARTRLAALRQLNHSASLTAAVQRELETALIAHAQNAGRAGQTELAAQYLKAAGEYGAGSELVSARQQLQAEIDAAHERAAEAAAPAGAAPPVAVAAGVATPAPPAPQTEFITARPVAPLRADYPQRALDTGQQGYVLVEFTLNTAGRASDVRVVESSPPSVFDDAAIAAVRRGRFATSALGTPAQPRRARLRITFRS